jgi:hypothetical protein
MAFPASPTNGQLANINNISYTYNTTSSTWSKTSLGTANVSLLTTSGGTISGPLTLASTLGVTGTSTQGTVTANVVTAQNGIFVNNGTVTASYSIATGLNGLSVGPITINSGVAVTVASGQRWVVL